MGVAYGNDSVDSHSLAAFIDNFTVGTAGWTRTTFAPLKRRDSRPLSYDGMDWKNGAQCRLSACDIRFVGPMLFTSELTGHAWRPLAVTIRSHQVDSLAATPVASVVRLAADLRLERSASGLTVRFPHPVGLSARISWSGVRESNPPHLLGRQRPKATRPTPLKSRALCLALRLPVSMRRIVACAGLDRGFSGGLRAGSLLSLPVCPRPCAGGKANQKDRKSVV